MQACTQWTHSDVSSQLATTPECLSKIGDRQSEKKRRNSDWRVICNVTRGIDAGRVVIRHRGVSDGSDGPRPLWQSHSVRTEMFFADVLEPSIRQSHPSYLSHGCSQPRSPIPVVSIRQGLSATAKMAPCSALHVWRLCSSPSRVCYLQ